MDGIWIKPGFFILEVQRLPPGCSSSFELATLHGNEGGLNQSS